MDLIEDLSAPALLRNAHVHLLDGVADYQRFGDLTLQGLETADLEAVAVEDAQTLEQGYEDLILANSLWFPGLWRMHVVSPALRRHAQTPAA